MNIWLINHYAVPPMYYPLARTTNFAKYLMRMGHTVTIFAASSVHNSDVNLITDGSLYREEVVDDVHYVYVRCRSYTGNGAQRIINMFEFPRRLKRVVPHFRKPDAVLASSATPLACMAGLKIAKKYGARAVGEVSDLWPLTFEEYGLIKHGNPLLIPMYAYEKKMYMFADAMVFTMAGGYDYIVEKGWDKDIPAQKVFHINNGVDLDAFDYNQENFRIEDEDLDNPDIFKVVYTGAIRRVNNLGLLVDAAKKVTDPKIKFLIWGAGDELEALKERVKQENIDNIVFKGFVEKKYIPAIVSRADVNVVHWEMSSLLRFGVSYNKLFDYLAAGRPLFSTVRPGHSIIEENSCGRDTSGFEPADIAKGIQELALLPEDERIRMGVRARETAKEYDFLVLTKKLIAIMEG